MNVIADIVPGFAELPIPTEGAQIFARAGGSTGGSGPPLLLPHGYPQTKAHAGSGRCSRQILLG